MDEKKKKLLEAVRLRRLQEILNWLIALKSENPVGDEREITAGIVSFLENLGYSPEVAVDDLGLHPSVILRIPGTGRERTIAYLGHVDTVPAGDPGLWKYPPFQVTADQGKWYGRGTADMKGSVACVLYFLELIREQRLLFLNDFLILLNADEESHNVGLKRIMDTDVSADFVLVGEPSHLDIHLGHRGVMGFQVDIQGKSAHAARAGEGINALYGAEALIREIRKLETYLEEHPAEYLGAGSICATVLECPGKVNMVPDQARLLIDRRLTTGETREEASRQMEQIVRTARHLTGCRMDMKITTCCPGGFCDASIPEVDLFRKNMVEILGQEPELSVFEASGEAGMIGAHFHAPVLIFGPGSIR